MEMSKDELVKIIERLLMTEEDLSFLSELDEEQMKMLVGCIREKVEGFK